MDGIIARRARRRAWHLPISVYDLLLLHATLYASTITEGYLRKLQHSFDTSPHCLFVLNPKYTAIVQVIHKYGDERGLQQLV